MVTRKDKGERGEKVRGEEEERRGSKGESGVGSGIGGEMKMLVVMPSPGEDRGSTP